MNEEAVKTVMRVFFLILLIGAIVIEFIDYGARAGLVMLLGLGALISFAGACVDHVERVEIEGEEEDEEDEP